MFVTRFSPVAFALPSGKMPIRQVDVKLNGGLVRQNQVPLSIPGPSKQSLLNFWGGVAMGQNPDAHPVNTQEAF